VCQASMLAACWTKNYICQPLLTLAGLLELCTAGRTEVLPVQWRKHLHIEADQLSRQLMPPGIPSLRQVRVPALLSGACLPCPILRMCLAITPKGHTCQIRPRPIPPHPTSSCCPFQTLHSTVVEILLYMTPIPS